MPSSRLLVLFALALPVFSAPVVLQNGTATFSQTVAGDFSIDRAINGSKTGAIPDGWAIFDGSTAPQTAAFETQNDVGFAGGTKLVFSLTHLYPDPHTVGRFRISITTDDRSLFADGLNSGGDVVANWVILNPVTAFATNGPTLTVQGDSSILASGANAADTVYSVTALTAVTGITGVRLEVMADASLPFQGPGRQVTNGNFVLTEFELDASAVPEPSTFGLGGLAIAAFALLKRKASR